MESFLVGSDEIGARGALSVSGPFCEQVEVLDACEAVAGFTFVNKNGNHVEIDRGGCRLRIGVSPFSVEAKRSLVGERVGFVVSEREPEDSERDMKMELEEMGLSVLHRDGDVFVNNATLSVLEGGYSSCDCFY